MGAAVRGSGLVSAARGPSSAPRSWVAAGLAFSPERGPLGEEVRPMVKGPHRGLGRISVFGSGYGALAWLRPGRVPPGEQALLSESYRSLCNRFLL